MQPLVTAQFNLEYRETIIEQYKQIKHHLDQFRRDMLKYEPSLASRRRNSKILMAPKKMKWALFMPEKIKKLEE